MVHTTDRSRKSKVPFVFSETGKEEEEKLAAQWQEERKKKEIKIKSKFSIPLVLTFVPSPHYITLFIKKIEIKKPQ